MPPTRAPGVNHLCEDHNDLGDNATGHVSFQNYYQYHTECWHIKCDKDVVISFSTLQLYTYTYLNLYTGKDSGNGTDFTLEKSLENGDSPMDVVLNGSAFVQFRNTYNNGSRLEFDYVCVDATTQAPPTPLPNTRAPGVHQLCEDHNDLGDNATGHVSFQKYVGYHTECWHIKCDKDVVISFSTLQLYTYTYLDLYSGKDSGNGTDFTLEKSLENGDSPMDVVLNGSAFVQFRNTYNNGSRLEFDYVCVDATTQAPPTPLPNTRAPGVHQLCEDHNDLGDNATGHVSFRKYVGYHTECWYIECDKDVVISFSTLQLDYYYVYARGTWHISNANLDLYTGKDSGNGTDFTKEKSFYNTSKPMDVVLSGSVFVQFQSRPHHTGWSKIEFNYVCVHATPQAPPTPAPYISTPPTTVPPTRAPGVNYVCEDHNDLGDNVTGHVSFQNYDNNHTECWHIECAYSYYDVVLNFTDILLSDSYVSIYSSRTGSGNDTNFNLEHDWSSDTSGFEGVELVVNGSAFVQFRSTYRYKRSYLDFHYECRALPPPAQTVVPTEAPETSQPSVPTTNAPLTVEDVDWCDVDADCRTYDDSAATCVDSKCVCSESAGFVNPVTKKTKEALFICVQPTKRGKVKLRLEWNVDCEQSNGAIEGAVRTAIEETTKGRTDTLVVSCGSTIFVVDVEDADITTVATEDMSELIVASLKKNEAAVAAGFATPMTVGSSVVPTLKCSAAGATEMVLVNGGCVALACESGYLLSSGSCVENNDSDDTLSTGAIVGIVLGCSAFVVIIIAVVAFFLCKGSKAKDTVCHPHTTLPLTVDHNFSLRNPPNLPLRPRVL